MDNDKQEDKDNDMDNQKIIKDIQLDLVVYHEVHKMLVDFEMKVVITMAEVVVVGVVLVMVKKSMINPL